MNGSEARDEPVVLVQVAVQKVRAEVNHVLFTDRDTEAQRTLTGVHVPVLDPPGMVSDLCWKWVSLPRLMACYRVLAGPLLGQSQVKSPRTKAPKGKLEQLRPWNEDLGPGPALC